MKIIIDLDSTIISTGNTIIKVWNKLNPNKQLNNKIEPVWDFNNVLKYTDIELKDVTNFNIDNLYTLLKKEEPFTDSEDC